LANFGSRIDFFKTINWVQPGLEWFFMAGASQHLPEPEQEIDAADPPDGHESNQPPGDRPADPDIEDRVEKGSVQENNRKKI
jgi:hypothetical protein